MLIPDQTYYSRNSERIGALFQQGYLNPYAKIHYEQHLNKTREVQNWFQEGGFTPWKKLLLSERSQMLENLLAGYASLESSINIEQGDAYHGSMQKELHEAEKTGNLNAGELDFLKRHVLKSEYCYKSFSASGQTSWNRLLLHERRNTFSRLLGDYLKGDYNPRG